MAWRELELPSGNGNISNRAVRMKRRLPMTRWRHEPEPCRPPDVVQERNRELHDALQAALAVLGDDDLPDNGDLSGAAVTDMMRAAVAKARQVQP